MNLQTNSYICTKMKMMNTKNKTYNYVLYVGDIHGNFDFIEK